MIGRLQNSIFRMLERIFLVIKRGQLDSKQELEEIIMLRRESSKVYQL